MKSNHTQTYTENAFHLLISFEPVGSHEPTCIFNRIMKGGTLE